VKIAIISQSYYPKPGGVTEAVYYSARELRARGHKTTIITTSYSGNDTHEEDVIRIGRNALVPVNGAWVNVTLGIGLKKRMEQIFRRGSFDIIQTHCPLVPTLPLLALKAASVEHKVVGTFHAAAESNIGYRIFRKPLHTRAERLDTRIAVSASAKGFAEKYFPGEYTIIPNGVDCKRFNPSNHPRTELNDHSLNILFVGRMDKRKGLPYLLRSLPLIRKKIDRKIRLILVGEGKLRKLFTPGQIHLYRGEIISAGRVPPSELASYYASADIFCSPATGQESFGIILLEAMASGVPVVASDIPGYRGIITHRDNGLLARPRDPISIAECVVELALDKNLRRKITKKGREKALHYSWSKVAGMLEECFYQTLGIQKDNKILESTGRSAG
jgi:phosphatidylinositol alpha-mannosyltransferase